MLNKRRRIKKTGHGGRTGVRGFSTKQTPIVGDDGVIDEIISHTQTQRNPHPDHPGDHEPRPAGFAARHIHKRRRRDSGPEVGQLQFTSKTPPPTENAHQEGPHQTFTGLRLTSTSPPLTRPTNQISFVMDTYNDIDDEGDELLEPATEIPQLAQPRLGYMSRFKKNEKRSVKNSRSKEGEWEDEMDDQEEEGGERVARVGYTKKIPGFWAPPVMPEGGQIYGDPIHHDEEDRGQERQRDEDEIMNDPQEYNESTDTIARGIEAGHNIVEDRTPLFLPHEENIDSTIAPSNTVTGPSYQPSMLPTARNQGSAMSGAQLCDDLLLRTSIMQIPIISGGKSAREVKREERAKRILRRNDHAHDEDRDREQNSADAHHVTGEETDLRDVIQIEPGREMAVSPSIPTAKERENFDQTNERGKGKEKEIESGAEAYRPRSSQIRRRQEFGLTEPGPHTQSTDGGPVWEASAFDATALGTSYTFITTLYAHGLRQVLIWISPWAEYRSYP